MFKKTNSKVFCIGCNKTGTTSVEKALKDLGYRLGDIPTGELLVDSYANRDFKKIIEFCKTADAFQDAPFSFHYTFIPLDMAFPNSKFILTERDSDEQWFNSLVNFHSKMHSKLGNVPTEEDLKSSSYRYKGFAWEVRQKVFGIKSGQDMYDRNTFINYYNDHNKMVKEYFRYRDNLLVINLSEKNSYTKLCDFLNKDPLYKSFPWENKTSEIK